MTEQNTRQQKPFKILLIGDVCIDEYQYGFVDRISPEAPIPVFRLDRKIAKSGMAGNVENNLSTLGCEVLLVHGHPSKKTRLIDSRSKQHIVRVDDDVHSEPLDPNSIVSLDFDAIVISDYNKGFVSEETIVGLRKNFDGPIFVDTKKRRLHHFDGCFIKINLSEYNLLETHTYSNNLIVTMGGEGALYESKIYPAPKVEVVDVTGAGDTFLAALTYKYLETKDIEQAIQFAISASSISVQHTGVYAPTLEEICG